jgi:hypothetical protein
VRKGQKRLVLVLGILMLVSGWGTTQYAEARQEGLSEKTRDKAWRGEGGFIAGVWIYSAGILAMAVGGVLVVCNKD